MIRTILAARHSTPQRLEISNRQNVTPGDRVGLISLALEVFFPLL